MTIGDLVGNVVDAALWLEEVSHMDRDTLDVPCLDRETAYEELLAATRRLAEYTERSG